MIAMIAACALFVCNLHAAPPAAPSDAPTEYTHREALLKKIDALELSLNTLFGKDNPFCELTAVAYLTAHLHEDCMNHLAHRVTPKYTKHAQALRTHLVALDAAISKTLKALVNDQPHDDAIKQLCHAVQAAGGYVGTHFSEKAKRFKHIEKLERSQHRFFGPLTGLGIFGGSFKYVIIGIVGATIMATVWKVYRAITHESRVTGDRAHENKENLYESIKLYKRRLTEYTRAVILSSPDYMEEMRDPTKYGTGKHLMDAWYCFKAHLPFQKKYVRKREARKRKFMAKEISKVLDFITKNPHVFGITDSATIRKISHACTQLTNWGHARG